MPEIKKTYTVIAKLIGGGPYGSRQDWEGLDWPAAAKIRDTIAAGKNYKADNYVLMAHSVMYIHIHEEPTEEI